MFFNLFKFGNSNNSINPLDSECNCGCGCTCDPTSAESAGRISGAGSVSRQGAKNSPTTA